MDIGLVNRVVPAVELDAFVADWAQPSRGRPAARAEHEQAAARPVVVDVARAGDRGGGAGAERQLRERPTPPRR